MKSSLNVLLGAAITIVVFLVIQAMFVSDPSVRNYEFAPDMAYSLARKPMSSSESLPLGVTQQHPVEGVVIRGATRFAFGSGKDEAERAGKELTNPVNIDELGVRERGAEAYAIYCTHCHGGTGGGDGLAVRRGMKPPPSLHGARAKTIADGEIYHIITMGQGNMASHAAQVSPEDRWKIIHHVRSIQAEGP